MKVITGTKIRLRHRHIGCLISTKDLKVNCQRQRSDRVSNTDMKSDGFVTPFGDIFGDGFGQLQHLCVLACVERG